MRKAPQKANVETISARKRNMRHLPTKAEFKMWSVIKDKQLGVKFLRQERIKNDRNDIGYFADYVCYERDLIIEVDNPTIAERAKDTERNEYFDTGGFTVLRFKDKDVLGNINACLVQIKAKI
jgi:very-short-patch-repair endonuclease